MTREKLNFPDTPGELILGLDVATKTGFSFVRNGQVMECGYKDFSAARGESLGMLFLKFRRWLEDLVKAYPPTAIFYEQAHYRGGAATVICVGLVTRIHEVADLSKIDYSPVSATTLKKWATGKGKAEKPVMISAANEKTGGRFNITDDDIADAVLISLYGAEQIMETSGVSKGALL